MIIRYEEVSQEPEVVDFEGRIAQPQEAYAKVDKAQVNTTNWLVIVAQA